MSLSVRCTMGACLWDGAVGACLWDGAVGACLWDGAEGACLWDGVAVDDCLAGHSVGTRWYSRVLWT